MQTPHPSKVKKVEFLDVFDESYQPLGPSVATIDDVHRKGLWHQTFACWVVNPENQTIMWQMRGPRNRIDPGSFDASASGHLEAGEKHADGFRELEEEVGLIIPAEDRLYLGAFRNRAVRGAYINREFCHVYLAKSGAAIDDLSLQRGEVSGVFCASIAAAIDLLTGHVEAIPVTGVEWNEQGYALATKSLALHHLCNWQERCGALAYYLNVMLAARAWLRGEKILHLRL